MMCSVQDSFRKRGGFSRRLGSALRNVFPITLYTIDVQLFRIITFALVRNGNAVSHMKT